MKILILLKKYAGGVGVAVKNVKEELEKRGHEVKVIARQDDLKLNSFILSLFDIRNIIKKELAKEDYDIIYTQDWSIAFPLLFPLAIYKRKHFCCLHGKQPGIFSGIMQKLVGNKMGNKIIVVGDSLKKSFPKSNLIFNGVKLSLFKPIKGIKKIKNSVGFANWKEDIYKYEKIKNAVKKAGKKLIVAENISYKKMPEFYNKLEAFISLPPKCTGFNMVWIEAMACNVPKIIGNNSGIGSKLPIDKINNFENIKEAISNSQNIEYRKKLCKEFTLDNHITKLINLWER